MCNAQDKELIIMLAKVNDALERIQRSLEPLVWRENRQQRIMPEVPVGEQDCPICEGAGFVQFINQATDLWTSRKCKCLNV